VDSVKNLSSLIVIFALSSTFTFFSLGYPLLKDNEGGGDLVSKRKDPIEDSQMDDDDVEIIDDGSKTNHASILEKYISSESIESKSDIETSSQGTEEENDIKEDVSKAMTEATATTDSVYTEISSPSSKISMTGSLGGGKMPVREISIGSINESSSVQKLDDIEKTSTTTEGPMVKTKKKKKSFIRFGSKRKFFRKKKSVQ